MSAISGLLTRPIRRFGRATQLALAAAVVLLVVAASALSVRAYMLRDSVLPGVRVAGVDVGGLSRADARARVSSALEERLRGPLDVSVDGRSFTVYPGMLFSVDAAATEEAAFELPRGSWRDRLGALAAPFSFEHEVEPVLSVNPTVRAALARAIAKRTKEPAPARIRMDRLEPVVVPAREGTAVDVDALLGLIRTAALGSVTRVEAPVTALAPRIPTAAAQEAAAAARALIAEPIAIVFRREELAELEPTRLVELLRFRRSDGRFELTLHRGGLEQELQPLAEPFTRKPVDASFRVAGERVKVVKGRPGTRLDVRQAERRILGSADIGGRPTVVLGLAPLAPELTARDARELGIRRQVSTYTTDMGVSSANRIWNVHLMADYIDGTIIEPGEAFSFNEAVGPRTVERGFREGQMILGSLLLPAIGGGVCQTATTLFNNAFELGLPVVERHNHSWYISHYPIGRDATVSWGGPDLKFRNDLDSAILIKTSYTDATLTFTFYGSKQGRRVEAATGPQTNFRAPQPSYAYDPSAPKGSVRTVAGSHQRGFDITVYRKVYERGKVIRRDSFTSHYVPVGDTVIYGPGTDPPRIDFVIPAI